MKILITGGAGFIGSHLAEELAGDKRNRVISLDNYSTGKKENHVPGVEYIRGDTQNIDSHIRFAPDLVFHLGEYARVEKSFDDMAKVWNSNKNGTFAVLEFCRKYGAKIIYAGSSTKFGDGGLGRDQSPYAWTKASNTELVRNYGAWFGIPYAITYFYNVYGGREISTGPFATVIGIFQEKRRRGEPLTVVSPGTQRRNFTHVDDIVSGLILVGERGLGDEYGLGAEKDYSILEIARMFGDSITMRPERKGNRMGASINTSKTRQLGWEAKHDVVSHIQSFLSSLSQN